MHDVDVVSTLIQMGRSFAWAIVAAVSFSFSMALAIKVFDMMSGGIDEWEEIKRGNWGVALIFVAMILSIGLVLHKVI